jgi:hypothetical protein
MTHECSQNVPIGAEGDHPRTTDVTSQATAYAESALVAEADGNRTRQRRGTPLSGFEDQGNHQESGRLRG